jgi:RHS repeat-associated protein
MPSSRFLLPHKTTLDGYPDHRIGKPSSKQREQIEPMKRIHKGGRPRQRHYRRWWLPVAMVAALAGGNRPAEAASYYVVETRYLGTEGACVAGVDIATGSIEHVETFGTLPGRVPIELSLIYRSQDATNGPAMTSTSFSTDWFVISRTGGGYELVGPSNHRFKLTTASGSDWINPTDPELLGAKLTMTGNGLEGTLTWKHGDKYRFNTAGELWKTEDRRANSVTISRNSQGYPTTITQPDGRTATIAYTSGADPKVMSVTLPSPNGGNRTWTFHRDTSGRVDWILNPKSEYTFFTWENSTGGLPLLKTVADNAGAVKLTNTFNTNTGKLMSRSYPDGGTFQIGYPSGSTTTTTDPKGYTTTWQYVWHQDNFGYHVMRVTDGQSRSTDYYRVGASLLVTSIADYKGRVTTLNWDHARGNLLSVTRPKNGGGSVTWSATYDTIWNTATSITDPLSHTTTIEVNAANGDVKSMTDARNNKTEFFYDATTGDLTSVKNALLKTTAFEYWPGGELKKITDPLGHITQLTWNNASLLSQMTDANLKETAWEYDDLGRTTKVKRKLNGVWKENAFTYTLDSNLKTFKDAKNQTWTWDYFPSLGKVTETNPLAQVTTYEFDQNDNLKTLIEATGQRREYTWGAGDRLTQALFKTSGGAQESKYTVEYWPYSTASTDLVKRVEERDGSNVLLRSFDYSYDDIDRLWSEVRTEAGNTWTNTHLYDDADRRTSVQLPSQGLITYGYNATDEITSITQNGLTSTFDIDALGRTYRRNLANGVQTEWTWDDAGFPQTLASWKGSTVYESHNYVCDNVGNITQDAHGFFGGWFNVFGYDDLYRITSATSYGNSFVWGYDDAGNRTSQTKNGVTTTLGYNSANRLTSDNGVVVAYDAHGNLTSWNSTYFYNWNARGELVSSTGPGRNDAFEYDYLGRRVKQTISGVVTYFLHDGADVVSEYSGGQYVHTLHSPEIDQPISRNGRWFFPDHRGSTSGLTDAAGTLVQAYLYSPFEKQFTLNGEANPFQFTGREQDASGLMHYRNRYYIPAWGRFLSEDPLGLEGGTNPYAYAENNPQSLRDPFGLAPSPRDKEYCESLRKKIEEHKKEIRKRTEDLRACVRRVGVRRHQ